MVEPKIELIISPTQKMKAKGMILSLLGQHGIDDERDINGIDYSQHDETSSLIGKCVIKFKKSEDAHKFYEHLNNQDDSANTLLSVKIKDVSSFEHDDSDFDESASVVLEPTSSASPKIRHQENLAKSLYIVNKQTSPRDLTKSCIVSKSDTTLLKEEFERRLLTINKNRVEFSITPAIANDDDLELMLLLIQNSRRTGGGDIEHGYTVNPSRTSMVVTYVEEECKKKVLSKYKFDFKHYTITANEPFDETNFEKNKHVLIIRNIKIENETDYTLVTLYAENLVPLNTVENIETSKLFENTHYVKFKDEYDFEQVELRQKRRPTIKKMSTEVLEAFKTNSLVGALENFEEISHEMLDLYFTNKNRSGVNKYLLMKDNKPFTIIQLYNQQQVDSVLSRKHVFNKKNFTLENYYNSKLLPHYIPENNIQEVDSVEKVFEKAAAMPLDSTPKAAEKIQIVQIPLNEPKGSNTDDYYIEIEQQEPAAELEYFDTLKKRLEESVAVQKSSQVNTSVLANSYIFVDKNVSQKSQVSPTASNNILIDEFKYKLNSNDNRMIYQLFKHNDKVFKDFKKILKPLNLALTKHSFNKEAVFEFSYLENCDAMSFEEFKQKCDEVLRDFSQEFSVYYNVIELPPGLSRENVNLKDLVANFPEVYLNLKENGIEFYGYRKYFGDIVDKVNGMTNRSVGSVNEKEDAYELVLSSKKLPSLLVFQYLPSEFINFKELLRAYSAQCMKQPTDNGFLVKITGDTEVDTEILRHELNAIIDNYLSAFKIEEVECENSNNVVRSILVDKDLHIEALSDKKVLICGRVAHVDEIVDQIKKKSIGGGGGGGDSFKPEINNVSLHEIRILYAVRYQAEMESKFPNLKVKIDSKKFMIKFESDDRSSIIEAMARAAEIFSQIKHEEYKCASIMIEFMRANELEVVKWIKDKNFLTVLDINYSLNAYLVYGLNIEVIHACNQELTKNLDLKMFKVTPENEEKIHAFIADEANRLIWTGEKRTSGYIAKIGVDNNIRFYMVCGFKIKVEALAKRFVDHLKAQK